MIITGDLIFAAFMLFTSIILLWITTHHMIKSKRIIYLLPFFFSSQLLILSAALSFVGVFDQKTWFVVEFSWAILFLWIFINIKGGKWR